VSALEKFLKRGTHSHYNVESLLQTKPLILPKLQLGARVLKKSWNRFTVFQKFREFLINR